MISLIVVDYNSIKKTIEYIEHFSMNVIGNTKYHYIIIDNYPLSKSEVYLEERYRLYKKESYAGKEVFFFRTLFGEICYVNSEENLGFAKGNNLGTLISDRYYDSEYYIISNNDLKLKNKIDWKSFENIFSDKKVAVIGPRVIGIDGNVQSPYKKVSPFYLLIVYQWTRFWPIKSMGDLTCVNFSGECYRVMGCFMIIRAEAFQKVNRFDENTFMYGEEMILSERLSKENLKCYFYNDFIVVHEHGVTVSKEASILQSNKWCFESLYYYCKEYRKSSHLLLVVAKINYQLNVLVIKAKCHIKKVLIGKRD